MDNSEPLMMTIILILIASSHNSKILLHKLEPHILISIINNNKNNIDGIMLEISSMMLIQSVVELA